MKKSVLIIGAIGINSAMISRIKDDFIVNTVDCLDDLALTPSPPVFPVQTMCREYKEPIFNRTPDAEALGKDYSFDRENRGPIKHRGKGKVVKR